VVTKAGGGDEVEKKSDCQTNNCLFGCLFGNGMWKTNDFILVAFCCSNLGTIPV
jgi:hypothetical protein